MDKGELILRMLVTQLGRSAATAYEGPGDRDSVVAGSEEFWQRLADNGAAKLRMGAAAVQEGLEVPDALLPELEATFRGEFIDAALDTGPRDVGADGKAPDVPELLWASLGPEPEKEPFPPAPARDRAYVLAEVPGVGTVYLPSPRHHEIGEPWVRGADGWTPFCEGTLRCASARGVWQGGYDPVRGGVMAWNISRGPIGVLATADGLRAYGTADTLEQNAYHRGAYEEVVVGDAPELDPSTTWGFDPKRKVWVAVSDGSLHEFDENNRWSTKAVEGLPELDAGDEIALGIWDPKAERLLFVNADTLMDEIGVWSWDGTCWETVSEEDFRSPEGLCGHPEHGLLAVSQRGKWHRLEGESWVELDWRKACRRAADLRLSCDGKGLVTMGPGTYGGKPSVVFWRRHGGAWEQDGVVPPKSGIETVRPSGGWPVLAAAGGDVLAVAWYRSLHTLRWDGSDWQEAAGQESTQEVFLRSGERNRLGLCSGPDGQLWSVAGDGAVFVWDGEDWSEVAGGEASFGSRDGFCLCFEPTKNRLVLWGGRLGPPGDMKEVNETWFFDFESKAWRSGGAERPDDRGYNDDEHGFEVDFQMLFDTRLEKVLWVGFEEVAVLEGDAWVRSRPQYLQDFIEASPRALAHDPVTQETLLISFRTGEVAHIDLERCDLVARHVSPEGEENAHLHPYQDHVFEPVTRRILAFDSDVHAHRAVLDLSAAFEAAKARRDAGLGS